MAVMQVKRGRKTWALEIKNGSKGKDDGLGEEDGKERNDGDKEDLWHENRNVDK